MSALIQKQTEFTYLIAELIHFAANNGYRLRFGDALRSTDPIPCPHCGFAHSYQEMLLKAGRSKTKSTKHGDRLAIDLLVDRADGVPMTNSDWYKLGEFWEDHSGRWGGRFGLDREVWYSALGWDPSHFEML